MQLLFLIAVTAVLTLTDASSTEPVGQAMLRLAAMCGVTFVTPAAAWMIARRVARLIAQGELGPATWNRLSWIYYLIQLTWLGSILLGMWATEWATLVHVNGQLANWPLVAHLAVLAPLLVSLVLIWAAWYEVDFALEKSAAVWQELEAPQSQRWPHVLQQMRFYFGLCLMPMIVVVAVHDFVMLAAPESWRAAPPWLIFGPALLLLLLLFQDLLKFVWPTAPLEAGPLRARLEGIAAAAGLRLRNIYVWQTRGRMLNAAVAGFVPRFRCVFLTDGLLQRFNEDQIAAAFAHEIGHIQRRHLLLRLFVLLLPILPWLALQTHVPEVFAGVSQWMATWGWGALLSGSFLYPIVSLAYAAVVLGWCCKLHEHDADLYAAGLATGAVTAGGNNVQHFIGALERLCAGMGIDRNRTSWLHPSIARRVTFLQQAANDPTLVQRFERRMRFVPLFLLLVALLISGGLWLLP